KAAGSTTPRPPEAHRPRLAAHRAARRRAGVEGAAQGADPVAASEGASEARAARADHATTVVAAVERGLEAAEPRAPVEAHAVRAANIADRGAGILGLAQHHAAERGAAGVRQLGRHLARHSASLGD